jgi:hypothetical protein
MGNSSMRSREVQPGRRTVGAMCVRAMVVAMPLPLVACTPTAVAIYDTASVSPESLTTRATGLRVGALTETGTLQPGDTMPSEARTDRFVRFTSQSDAADSVLRTIQPGPDGSVTIDLDAGSVSAASGRSVLVYDASGDLLLASNRSEEIDTQFEPLALFLPATLQAGQEIVRQIGVRSTGNRFNSGTGKGTSTVTGVGTQLIEVPAGLFEAFVVDSRLSFTIGPARIELTQRAWFALDGGRVGIVAEEGRELVKVLGLPVHNQSRVSVLGEQRVEND